MANHTKIDDLLDLDNFDPQNEKENYMGFHDNIDQYAAQSSQTALGNGYPENTPPPEMFMETLEKARKPPVPGIIPSMVETFQAPQENIERYDQNASYSNYGNYNQQPSQQPSQQPNQQPSQQMNIEQVPINNTKEDFDYTVAGIPSYKPTTCTNCQGFNCNSIADHIEQCKICSRYYDNDNSIYMVIIVILLVICALLTRKVLNL